MNNNNTQEPVKGQVFTSQVQCSAVTGISTATLRFLKKKGAPGFRGSCIYWDLLKPHIDANKDVIDNNKEDSLYDLRMQEKKIDIRLKKLEEKKLEGQYLDPKDVTTFLMKLRLAFESTVKGWSSELPSKLVGLSVGQLEAIITKEVGVLLTQFSSSVKEKVKECSPKP